MTSPVILYSNDYEDSFASCRRGCVISIDSDSFIVKFEKHLLIVRMDPFSSVFDLKFPLIVSGIDFKPKCLSSILHEIRTVHNLPIVTSNLCRDTVDSSNWNFVNQIFYDALFMQELSAADRPRLIDISICSKPYRLLILLVQDGQVLLYRNLHGEWEYVSNLTRQLIGSNLIFRADVLKRNQTLNEREKANAISKPVVDVLFQLKLARMVSSNIWLFTSDLKCEHTMAISIQRDNSLILWDVGDASMQQQSAEVTDIVIGLLDEDVSSAILYTPTKDNVTHLLLGTSSGNIYSCRVSSAGKRLKCDSLTKVLEFNDDKRIFDMIIDSSNGLLRLIASKSNLFVVAHLTIASCGVLKMKAWRLVSSASKFPTLSLTRIPSGFVSFCRSELSKCELGRQHGNLDLEISPFLPSIGLDSKKLELLGFCGSGLGTCCVYCLGRKIPQKTCGLRQYKLRVLQTKDVEHIWKDLLTENDFNKCINSLTCLRYNLLSGDSIPGFIISYVDNFRIDEQSGTYQLMLFRFVLKCLLRRQDGNLKGSYAAWADTFPNVEHRLLLRRAEKLVDYLEKVSNNDKKILINAKDVLSKKPNSAASSKVVEKCPICGDSDLKKSPKDALVKKCTKGHHIPICCSTLLCVVGLEFRKCTRCYAVAGPKPLNSKDDWKNIMNYCGLCDGVLSK